MRSRKARARCILVLTVVPDYLRPAIEELSRALDGTLELLVGSSFFSETVPTDPELLRRYGRLLIRPAPRPGGRHSGHGSGAAAVRA
jgi:hypothetical protein